MLRSVLIIAMCIAGGCARVGSGRMRMSDFGVALRNAIADDIGDLLELRVVVRRKADAQIIRGELAPRPNA